MRANIRVHVYVHKFGFEFFDVIKIFKSLLLYLSKYI